MMKIITSTIISISFLLWLNTCALYAQPNLDSLHQKYLKATSDSSKISALIEIGDSFEEHMPDSALFYYKKAEELAFSVKKQSNTIKSLMAKAIRYRAIVRFYQSDFENSLELFHKSLVVYNDASNLDGVISVSNSIGNIHYKQGSYDLAIEIYSSALQIAIQIGDSIEISNFYVNIGNAQMEQGNNSSAIENFLKALSILQELNNNQYISICYNNLGIAHFNLKNYGIALEYQLKSLEIAKNTGDDSGISNTLNNIGIIYHQQDDYDNALSYYIKALKLFENENDLHGITLSYNNIGEVYREKGDIKKAVDYFNKALVVANKRGDRLSMTALYNNLASAYIDMKEYSLALNHAKKALSLSKEIGSISSIYYSYGNLSVLYDSLGDYKNALEYYKFYAQAKDSVISIDKNRQIAEIEARYRTQEKQKEIEKQQLLLEKKEEVIKRQDANAARQRTIRNGLILGFVLLLGFSITLFRGYQYKKRMNQHVIEQNNMLEQANAEVMAQRDEVEAQREMLMKQNQRLEEVHTHITHSLHYARSIQAAILPSEKILDSISHSYFVLMKPFQVVSGDFFWAANFDDYKIFCVADCTGHGVPGAFMSILGVNALNDIVVRHRIFKPQKILLHLRESVINALAQNDPNHLHKDGIDMALCVFNSRTRMLEYSGARLPLWIVLADDVDNQLVISQKPKSIIQHNGHSLYEIKADNMPVGMAPRMNPFTQNAFSLGNNHATIYLTTDGYADQFSEIDSTKFGSLRLKKMLLQNINKPFSDQKILLENEFDAWMGNGYQIDDATVLGIQL
jgi:tetratricopeptide (TPR) repeat protein